jgi:two-component sensor histidine kinase
LWVLNAQQLFYYREGWDSLEEYAFDYKEETYRFRSFSFLENGKIWVTSDLRGLYIADPKNGTIDHFSDYDDLSENEFLKYVDLLHLDKNGRLWLGYKNHLHLYLPGESLFYDLSSQINDGEPFVDLFQIYEDEKGIWIATTTGVYLLQYQDLGKINVDKITPYRTTSLTTDNNGDLWMTNGRSIHRLSIENESIQAFTKSDGLPETTRVGFENISMLGDGRIFLSARRKFAIFHPNEIVTIPENPVPYFDNAFVDGIETDLIHHNLSHCNLMLNRDQNSVTLGFGAISYSSQVNTKFKYKLEGVNDDWVTTSYNERNPTYANLKGGDYRFLVAASGIEDDWSEPAILEIIVGKNIWERSWFYPLLLISISGALLLFYQVRMQRVRRENETQLQILNLEKQALQAQMNPHFVFNAMNSIQHLIANGEDKKSMLYLNKFGKLLRSVLDSSGKNTVKLSRELEMLENYILLESLRFEGAFTYTIKADTSLEFSDVEIPGFILQPVVENAIQHGLLPKKDKGHLKIHLEDKEEYVLCTIEDDGIGRKASNTLKSGNQHQSMGLDMLKTRLKLLNQSGMKDVLRITDLEIASGEAAGTKVEVKLPIKTT